MNKCECKKCVNFELCAGWIAYYEDAMVEKAKEAMCRDEENKLECEFYKDKSLCVELPCKVGDDLFVISQTKDKRILPFVNKYLCTSISIKKRSITVYHEMDGYIKIFKETDFGKTVFTNKEDAKAKLKELEGK